jgi:DUF4097 and DUF4098 domain-containing protein YvlB
VLLAAQTALFGAAGITDTFHWSGRVSAGQFLEVRGINGNIHAEPARGESIDVIASKSGHVFDPSEIELKVVQHDDGITICAVYPSASGNTRCENTAEVNNDVSVDFTVRVPSGVRFVARTVNGLVEAKALDADTEAHTVNGDVVLSTARAAQGETVNGSITATLGKIPSELKFSTVNGGITLEVPHSASANVHAKTVNGPIQTDFALPVRGQFLAKRAEGAIGRGGPDLRIATVNGGIRLRRNKGASNL